MIINGKNYSEYFYDKLPAAYRKEDLAQMNTPLKRYLESLVEGGFNPSVQDTLGVLDLIDVEKCPSEFLPYLCENYGLKYSADIDEVFQRKFLSDFTELKQRIGTLSFFDYIVRELSGYLVTITESGNNLNIVLTAYEDDVQLATKQGVITRYISCYIPVGMILNLVTLYNYEESADFWSLSTDIDTPPVITQNIGIEPSIICTESYVDDIIESLGEETASYTSNDGVFLSLTNLVPSTATWFYSSGYSVIDKVTQGEIQTIIFN
jgi:hypothetical protein